MGHRSVKEGLQDVAAGLLTPFDKEQAIDHAALADNARTLSDRGISTFLACANISEYHSLSQDERIAVTETSVEALPDETTVLAGVGGSTRDAIDLATAFASLGADAIMMMPPHHAFVHERGLLTYYRKLSEAVDLPLVPYIREFDPSVRFLADVTRLDSVAGVKYAIPNIPKFSKAVAAGADDVVWVNGMAEPHAPALWAEGAEGFTAGVSNFEPRIGLALFDALSREKWERAREIRNACQPFMDYRRETGTNNTLPAGVSVPVVKEGLRLAGFTPGLVREPLVELTAAEKSRAEALYADLESFETPEVNG